MSTRRGAKGERETVSPLLTLFLLAGLTGVLVFGGVLLGGRQFTLLRYYDQIRGMEKEVVALQFAIRQSAELLESVESDPYLTEKVARERMNYSLPGELIFRFEEVE